MKEPKVAFDRGVCHTVFATGPLRHLPKLCFRCQQDERDLVIFCSFPSAFHLPSTCHPSTPPPPSGFQKAGISLPRGICIWRAVSVKRPAVTLSAIFRFMSLFTHSFLSVSVPLPSTFSPFPCQIFEGNSNYDTPELRTVEPLLTRFIRIYPERATPAGMGLRLELLGCEIEGKLEPS